jgi:hypothetical protein
MEIQSQLGQGCWIIHYSKQLFSLPVILQSISQIADWFKSNRIQADKYRILFDSLQNFGFCPSQDNAITVNINQAKPVNLKNLPELKQLDWIEPNIDLPVIQSIHLAFPFLNADVRWQSIQLTAAAVFLGSELTNQKFFVSSSKLNLNEPVTKLTDWSCDLLGFTLFEDLFAEFSHFLTNFSPSPRPLLAAGGPLITLHPFPALFHLPQLNLLIRGEAELIFPKILTCLNERNFQLLQTIPGFILNLPGLLILSETNFIHYPKTFSSAAFNLNFLKKENIEQGLEINFSRGCRHSCLFCSKIQGKKVRALPVQQVNDILEKFQNLIGQYQLNPKTAAVLNINDDDILQNESYARSVFKAIRSKQFKCWGIQVSLSSLIAHNIILESVINLLADPDLFVNNQPLVWIGTDIFLQERCCRLGKKLPSLPLLEKLIKTLEEKQITNYHYWICSDYDTTWQEFIEELQFIYHLKQNYRCFGLLPHAPFVIPYSSTAIHQKISKMPNYLNLIKYKELRQSRDPLFNLPLALRLETRFHFLNQLLQNQCSEHQRGFFDYLQQSDFLNAFLVTYNFLKKERLMAENHPNSTNRSQLYTLELNLENQIALLI